MAVSCCIHCIVTHKEQSFIKMTIFHCLCYVFNLFYIKKTDAMFLHVYKNRVCVCCAGCKMQLVHALSGQSSVVLCCAYSADGQLLVSG